MNATEAVKLTIYLSESTRSARRPLYEAVIELLQREGIAGVTVLHGIAGYGADKRMHTLKVVRLSGDLPVVLVAIDRRERVDAVLPQLDALISQGLVTIEPVESCSIVRRYPATSARSENESPGRHGGCVCIDGCGRAARWWWLPVQGGKRMAERDGGGERRNGGAAAALLLIDVINDMEFVDADRLFEHALPAARRIARLRTAAKRAGLPVIYANDNFGRWRSDFKSLVRRCTEEDVRGRPIVELLRPDDDDYFVLKPSYSAFFATPLDLLLDTLDVNTLVLAGFAGNMCILFSANDAYMRGYRLFVPADCTASNTLDDNAYALHHAREVLGADTRDSDALNLEQLAQATGERGPVASVDAP